MVFRAESFHRVLSFASLHPADNRAVSELGNIIFWTSVNLIANTSLCSWCCPSVSHFKGSSYVTGYCVVALFTCQVLQLFLLFTHSYTIPSLLKRNGFMFLSYYDKCCTCTQILLCFIAATHGLVTLLQLCPRSALESLRLSRFSQ